MTWKLYTLFALLSFLFCATLAEAQRNYDIHWIQFTDKNNSPYSLFKPQEFLSPRALERRVRLGIPIDEYDLPPNPEYVKAILGEGFRLHFASRWMNGIGVIGSIENLGELEKYDFVDTIRPIGYERPVRPPRGIGERDYKENYEKKKYFHGDGHQQISMLNTHLLHQMGYRGEGIHIAVFDGGFIYMPETPAFDSIFVNKQILGTHDFVEGDSYVFEASSHGTNVLSTIASNMPYSFVGTAPDASFYLFKTEDEAGELVIEEFQWLAAAERADSLGVDVINSSLGYHNFDDDAMDYAYEDLNGTLAVITQAANMASSRGILVVTSAGNEGNGKWKHITAPGDSPNVLTVGAVGRDGYHAKFSSYGFEDRVSLKPNVVARGKEAVIAMRKRYATRYTHGTSFSSPIMAGASASLLQACRDLDNHQVIQLLQEFGSQSHEPDNALGYGIPDFFDAYKSVQKSVVDVTGEGNSFHFHPNFTKEKLDVFSFKHSSLIRHVSAVVYDMYGAKILESKADWRAGVDGYYGVEGLENLPAGVYFVEMNISGETKRILFAR